MNFTERRERFRTVLNGSECINPAPVHDATSARIADDLGFEVGFMNPAMSVETVLGEPHLQVAVLLTLTELAMHVRHITRASNISLLVSAEYGFGNALNVMRTVDELENAGASAISIEDADLPAGFGRASKDIDPHEEEKLISLEEGIGKIKAAVAARQDPSTVIVARTNALLVKGAGLSEAIRRINAYEKAGADAVFIPFFRNAEDVEALHRETRLPLMRGHLWDWEKKGGNQQLLDNKFLAANGIRIASAGALTTWAAQKAVYDILKGLRDGKSPDEFRPMMPSHQLRAQITRRPEWDKKIRAFLS